jgi:hypothetical protein
MNEVGKEYGRSEGEKSTKWVKKWNDGMKKREERK